MEIVLERLLSLIGDEKGSIRKFAKLTGIGEATIANWKRGQCKSYVKYLDEITSKLNIPKDYFSTSIPVRFHEVKVPDEETLLMAKNLKHLIDKSQGGNTALAKFLGATERQVCNWKSGRSSSFKKYILQISEYYNVLPSWFYVEHTENI